MYPTGARLEHKIKRHSAHEAVGQKNKQTTKYSCGQMKTTFYLEQVPPTTLWWICMTRYKRFLTGEAPGTGVSASNIRLMIASCSTDLTDI